MPKVIYVTPSGDRREIDAKAGTTVMENAVRNDVPGIEAECGGACACATCHVYVDEAWTAKLPEPEAMEEDMLDFAFAPQDNSRLSCQIIVNDDIDGITVTIPEEQA
ncbi:ferredoxin [Fulvimarina pelagi HTCC2506]|uniref:Ferredoxin n=2 Tax=Fulvimarina pelagi TaxID=217511 RepID=Q0G026_9HYPH|nr:2Fe-2S iron-sulfur cluster-binding protein [Fulvimarina pelagi]EAU40767.1 ferredoxin [Fulvimarina pelagi HTCC2506]BAT31309.1 ferredoxin [Fulvimarina pelagi]